MLLQFIKDCALLWDVCFLFFWDLSMLSCPSSWSLYIIQLNLGIYFYPFGLFLTAVWIMLDFFVSFSSFVVCVSNLQLPVLEFPFWGALTVHCLQMPGEINKWSTTAKVKPGLCFSTPVSILFVLFRCFHETWSARSMLWRHMGRMVTANKVQQ